MKHLQTSTKNDFSQWFAFAVTILACLGLTGVASRVWAGDFSTPVAAVKQVTGNVFVMTPTNETKLLSKGDSIADYSEVLTEEGGQITLKDNSGRLYHLAGQGHIRFADNAIELKRGYLWPQSFDNNGELVLQSANSRVTFSKRGEGIFSFDPATGKTQVLVIQGSFELSNALERSERVEVPFGHFSFVDSGYNDGRPRKATPIGLQSFQKVMVLFDGVNVMDKNTLIAQNAAAKENVQLVGNPVVKGRLPASDSAPASPVADEMQNKLLQDELKKMPNKNTHEVKKEAKQEEHKNLVPKVVKAEAKTVKLKKKASGDVEMKIFGLGAMDSSSKVVAVVAKATRKPAANTEVKHVKKSGAESAFEKSLSKEYDSQPKHSSEVRALINELKTFDMDYKADY